MKYYYSQEVFNSLYSDCNASFTLNKVSCLKPHCNNVNHECPRLLLPQASWNSTHSISAIRLQTYRMYVHIQFVTWPLPCNPQSCPPDVHCCNNKYIRMEVLYLRYHTRISSTQGMCNSHVKTILISVLPSVAMFRSPNCWGGGRESGLYGSRIWNTPKVD